MKVTERGQVTIPKAIRDRCGFTANSDVEFKLHANGMVTINPKRNMEDFDKAVAEYRGSATKRLRKLGFKSTDEFIEAIRGR